MVENSANITRKFTANACLYRDLGLPRRFLRRNLTNVLDAHERQLHQTTLHPDSRQTAFHPTSDDAPSHEDMIANERRAAGWDFPTKEMLDDLTKGDKPVLRLDALQIRHPSSISTKRERSSHDDRDEELDWLPNPEATATWTCQVSVNVRANHNDKRGLYMESRDATISQYQQTSGEPSHFEVTLTEPFLIEVSKLFVAVETGTNGFRHWRRTVTNSYNLEVSVQCRDSDDTADFLSELESQPRSKYEQILGSEGILRAVWDELPRCPDSGQLLPTKRSRGHSVINPEYGMELSMGWTRRRESPLQRYNKASAEWEMQNRQLLTPSSSEDAHQATTHVITYRFREGIATRVRKVDGLQCPLCRERSKTFSRLLLHCSTFHDHFRFDVDESQQETALDSSVVSKTILLSVSQQQHYEKITEQGADEGCNWVAPQRPFDLQAHLAGDDSWTGYTKPKVPKKRGRNAGAQFKDVNPVTAPRPVAKRPEPENVPDLPLKGRKNHVVPDVPGVRFYHTLSKKAIEPGEIVVDSDESVDEFWMMDVQRLALKELSINGAAQDFTMAFNRHLAREQSSSSVLMKEAVVRFTRLHRRELQHVGWQRPFRKKLEQLQNAGVINRLTVTHCVQLLQKDSREDVEMTNGSAEQNFAKGSGSLDGQPNGVRHPMPNGLGVNGVAGTRTPSLEPGGRGTPITDRERKGKERVRWGVGGSVSRGTEHNSPIVDHETPNGTSRSVKGKPDGVLTNGMHPDDPMDIDDQAAPPQINGFYSPANNDQTKGKEKEKQQQGDLCVCGMSARDTRAAIICSNLKCTRKHFHLACVGLERRQNGWRCADCAPVPA